jgi:hypothetical protein
MEAAARQVLSPAINMMPRLIEVGPRLFHSDVWKRRQSKS